MTANDHFYTTSADERDNAVANLGYQSEGIACYALDIQQPGTIPLFRLVKDTHFYTTSADERAGCQKSAWPVSCSDDQRQQ